MKPLLWSYKLTVIKLRILCHSFKELLHNPPVTEWINHKTFLYNFQTTDYLDYSVTCEP